MLGRRFRRWDSINPVLGQYVLCLLGIDRSLSKKKNLKEMLRSVATSLANTQQKQDQ